MASRGSAITAGANGSSTTTGHGPRHSTAKGQRIKAINERNEELCREIMELEEVQKNIKAVMTKVQKEKKVIGKAEIAAKEDIIMPTQEYNKMMYSIRQAAKQSMYEHLPPMEDDDVSTQPDFSALFQVTEDDERFARSHADAHY